jgi:HSP20 family protein
MLLRWDPFRDLDRELDRLTGSLNGGRSYLPMDAYRHGDQFVIHFDMPGVDPGTIDVTVEKNVLTVSAERSWKPSEGQQVVVSERPQGRFSRQVFLGDALDADRVEASYDQGVLSVTIPVAEQAKPRKVAINASQQPKAIDTTSTS